jgi:hypothetical protein
MIHCCAHYNNNRSVCVKVTNGAHIFSLIHIHADRHENRQTIGSTLSESIIGWTEELDVHQLGVIAWLVKRDVE